MSKLNYMLMAVVTYGLLASTPAFARRSQRTGLNFGTTVRILNTDDRGSAGEGSDKNTKVSSTSQAVNPYVGYSFGALNLGLMLSAESKTTNSRETSETDGSETLRTSELNGKGASLFLRFLFGQVFYFESGAGVYQETLKVKTETKTSKGGSFTGQEDEYEIKGVGPGYHLGAGIELEMGGGFFFTSAYQVRIVQLRDYEGGSDLGRKRSTSQKREVLFGISHYFR